ncbi:hypothetical protein EFM47_01900 [Streptococcus thermophilus]|uniref:phage tail spike protein n=1 Tax=Streptococcus thermophilus TaxID=1308 RepID=UPI0021A6B2AF|nr:phage tail spike protein [Streptococcus thermophilus]MCT2902503.1 hypothetical protein [Streptococcus thermophilus]
MLLTIHDANLQKIGFIDNEKQETLNFYDDSWNRNLETASSTFEFTVSKKELLSDTANKPLYNQLSERSFVSFKHKGQTYLFNIMKVEENERWIRCYCENLNLELINEYTNPYKADRPMSFAEYLDVFDIPQFAMVSLGVNEISGQKRTLEWEGQETKLARLLSLANKFDAEVEFETRLNDDSSIKQLVLNVYHKADDSHTGVGRIRGDIRLTFEKNIKSMTRKVDKTEIYTMVVPYGKSKETHGGEQEVRVYIDNLPPWEEKDDNGIVIFKQEGANLYAPHAADLYPSTFGVSTQSNKWIRKDLEVDSDNPNVIRAAGIANLRKHAYPAITYEVDGYVDVEIGDTITIHDKGFTPALDIRARAVEQKISFSNPINNKTTFGNFKEIENRTSGDLRSVFERMVENSRPYNIMVSTDNGVLFKNNTGQSTLRPTLKRGNQVINATYRFVIDGSIVSSGLTYTVKASDITKPTVITISAWVDNKEVASEEITFLNVSDGKQGPKGDKGERGPQGPKGDRGNDGLPGKGGVGLKTTTIIYGISDSDTAMPKNWSSQVPTLVKGKYLWTKTTWTYTDNSSETGYQKTYIAKDGNDGNDGLPGKDGVGIKTTTITYASGTSGTTAPASGWSSQVPNVPAGQYLWTKTVWDYTDNTSETGYSVAKMGETGPKGDRGERGLQGLQGIQGPKGDQGIPGPKGADGKTQYTHIAYADTISGSGFSQTDTNKAYIGMYQDFNAEDSQNPQDYRWSKWKGSDGKDGIPGKAGADGKTTYFHTAWSYSADGTDGFTTVYPNLNLLVNSSAKTKAGFFKNFDKVENGYGEVTLKGTNSWPSINLQDGFCIKPREYKPGDTYTISMDVMFTSWNVPAGTSVVVIWLGQRYTYGGGKDVWKSICTIDLPKDPSKKLNQWIRITKTSTIPPYENDSIGTEAVLQAGIFGPSEASFTLRIRKPKQEPGSVATPHMPSASEVTTADYPSFIGQYTNYTQVDSPNPRDYTWSLIRGNDGKQGPKGEQGPRGDQGIPGPKGADGRTQYTHIAYADTISGSGFSQTDVNKAYIGMYQDFNAEDSKNPQDYRWSKWKGSDGKDGIPGKPGADGRTPYFHRAWAYSADGRDGFSTSDSTNKRYLGTLTDFNEADSQDPTRYKWTALFDNVLGGNRNYFKNGRTQRINTGWAETYDMRTYIVDDFWKNPDRLKPYHALISFEISLSPALSKDTQANVYFSASPWYNSTLTLKAGVTTPQKFEFVINLSGATETYKADNVFVRFGTDHGFPPNLTVTLDNAMLSIGTNFLGYVKAIEDVESDINSKADQVLTQEQLNALNEKAGIIQAELEAKASAATLDNWLKAYQDYVKANDKARALAEKDLVSATQRVSNIAKDLGELSDRWNFIDTYMSSSNDGLVIGKNDGSSSIMFNPNGRISMYSAGSEVMYISQGVIHIENGIFSKTIQVGRYREEQYHLNPDMNVIRYVGGF